MAYAVKEIFYSLQGEGANTGRAAAFCRFAGCNLWSGREQDRHNAVCRFCDTDFLGTDGPGGGRYETAEAVVDAIADVWTGKYGNRLVVCTGGEPILQLDASLIEELHARDFRIAVETNGTLPIAPEIDWVCVSPKSDARLVVKAGDELKLVYPQRGIDPDELLGLAFDHFFLQPMDGPDLAANTQAVTDYCLSDPRWRVSLQTHKVLGIR
jgi:7-carboxy-7-deazaguanine synthase